jgi:lipoyl-dependent peroxiredoxin
MTAEPPRVDYPTVFPRWRSMRAPVSEYVSPRRTSNAHERIRHPNTTNRESTMPIAIREAAVVWDGPLASGTGTLTSGSGALSELPVTWASRTERADGKTSPEQLIAAADASCFAMALSLVLDENKTPPDRVTVNAACTLDEVQGAPRITTLELTVGAQVPGIEDSQLERIVERAADLCPVSNALRGNVEITVRS